MNLVPTSVEESDGFKSLQATGCAGWRWSWWGLPSPGGVSVKPCIPPWPDIPDLPWLIH